MKKKAIIFFGIVSLVFGSVFMSIPESAKAEKQGFDRKATLDWSPDDCAYRGRDCDWPSGPPIK